MVAWCVSCWTDQAGNHPPVPEAPSGGRANYLIGADPRRWHTGIPVFARVRYPDVYPGIDVVYYGTDRGRTRARSSRGARRGSLAHSPFRAGAGRGHRRPIRPSDDDRGRAARNVAGTNRVQIVGGARRVVAARFVTSLDDRAERAWRLRFAIGRYDPSLPLVIDPVVVYGATPGNGFGYEVAVDAAGHAFVTGFTTALQTIPGALQGGFQGGTRDAFVTRLDPAGRLVGTRPISAAAKRGGSFAGVDGGGRGHRRGLTQSSDFPSAAPWQPMFGGGSHDAFLADARR